MNRREFLGTAAGVAAGVASPFVYKDLELPRPFDYQRPLLAEELPGRFNFHSWGTKAGKTTSMIMRLATLLWNTKGKRYRWIAPFHEQSQMAEERMMQMLGDYSFIQHLRAKRTIIGPQGSRLSFHSGEKPDTLVGQDIDGVVLDEAARMREEVYDNCLTTLTFTKGWLIAISTPTTKNWFYRHYRMGEDREAGHYSTSFPSRVNPMLDPELIAQAKAQMPLFRFEQLYLAKFVADTSQIFPDLAPVASRFLPENWPTKGRRYIIAVDVGQMVDYNVSTVWDLQNASLVSWHRVTGMDYPLLEGEIEKLSRRWNNARVYVERNGPGQGIVDHLRARGVRVGYGPDKKAGVFMSHQLKTQLVHIWGLALRNKEPMVPTDSAQFGWPQLHREHEDYEYSVSDRGAWHFSAPEGKHDDIVSSCIIGWWAILNHGGGHRYWRPGQQPNRRRFQRDA